MLKNIVRIGEGVISCFNIEYVDTVYTSGIAYEVVVKNGYVYVTTGPSGLIIFDASDPTKIWQCDTPGDAEGIAVQNNYVYVGDEKEGLQVIYFDPSPPSPLPPQIVNSYDTNDAEGVFIKDDIVYLADGEYGLKTFDIFWDPANPILKSSFNCSGVEIGVFVYDNYAYVASFYSGLHILSLPLPPTICDEVIYPISGPGELARRVYVSDNHAYVAAGNTGLYIIDITNPLFPSLVEVHDTPGAARNVYISGNFAYVADQDAGLRIIDVSDPTSPFEADYYNTPGTSWGVWVSDNYIYIADGLNGVVILKQQLLGPTVYGLKEDAITELEALLAIDTNDDDLEQAIHYLKQSLHHGFDGSEVIWLDDNHIDEEKGADVFQYEQEAVDKLIAYLENDENAAFDFEDEIFAIIENMYNADKSLAEIAIEEAEAASGDSDKIDEANYFFAEATYYWNTGDLEEIADNVFDFLQKAWEKAVESW